MRRTRCCGKGSPPDRQPGRSSRRSRRWGDRGWGGPSRSAIRARLRAMGIFSRIKGGISAKANAAIDKAVDPAKELDMAILELEEGRKKALTELVSYKATAKQLDADIEKHRAKATEWERRAMAAVKAGDDEAAKLALREKKAAEAEAAKIERDKHEAASYAIQLNKSRKEFETKLQMLKLRKGALGGRRRVRERLVGVGPVQGGRGPDRSRGDRERGRRGDARGRGRGGDDR